MQTCKIEQFLQCGLWKWAGYQKLPQDFWLQLDGVIVDISIWMVKSCCRVGVAGKTRSLVCQGKTRIQLQVQLKCLLRSQNTKLGQSRGPEAVIQGKENKQEQGISPIRPPVTPRGREGKALGDQRPQSKCQSRRNVRVGSVQYTESVMTQRQSWKLPSWVRREVQGWRSHKTQLQEHQDRNWENRELEKREADEKANWKH